MTTGRIKATKLHMRPRTPYFNAPNCAGRYVVHSRNATPRYTGSAKFSDRHDLFRSQLRAWYPFTARHFLRVISPPASNPANVIAHQAHTHCVMRVRARRDVFQVFNAIISLDAVNVIDHKTRRARAKKRRGDQTVNDASLFAFVVTKLDRRVSLLRESAFQYAGCAASGPRKNSTDAALVADFVQALPADHRFPDFADVRVGFSHAVHSLIVNGLIRPVQSLSRLFGPLCIITV